MRNPMIVALAIVAAAAVAACGALESLSLAVAPSSLVIEPTMAASTTVIVERDGGFAELVSLALEGAPAGVTGTLADDPLAGTETELVVAIAEGVPTRTYEVTVRGSAARVSHASTLSVTVTRRRFEVDVSPDAAYVPAGGTETVLVGVQRSASFTEAVDLELLGAPLRVAGTFDPNPSAGDGSTLTLAVDDAVAPGS